MSPAATARGRVKDLLAGRVEGTVAVPLALASAARIQERDWEEFTEDPTQLANGLRDLVDAVAPDGVPVSSALLLLDQAAGPLLAGAHGRASVDATARLKASLGERACLLASLPGPEAVAVAMGVGQAAAAELVLEAGREYLSAGADIILLNDRSPISVTGAVGTLQNIARFHQALVVFDGAPDPASSVTRHDLTSPAPSTGVVVTDREIERHHDITDIENWVDAVQA